MDVYTVTKVAPTIDGHGFNVMGHGRPVVHFGYEQEREAIAAVEHVRQAIIKAKLIVSAGRLSPVQQIAASIATRLRTVDAVKSTARVSVDALVEPAPRTTRAWEAVRDEAFATSDIGPMSPAHFLFPSRMISLDPEIRDYARESFAPGRPVLDAAIELMNRLKSDIAYEIGATTVTTTPPMSFALRRGVCQDFAHIMISGLRGIGLPAVYVSGYLRSLPRTDATRLQGADAMHAWVRVWCGSQTGWIGLDPTNAILASDEHIVLALGRDYTDVAPMDGVIVGSGGQRIDVAVSVTPAAS
jgi:transglutaminase-like putative cysteine protease